MSNPVSCAVGNLSTSAMKLDHLCRIANNAQTHVSYATRFPKPEVVVAFVDSALSELFEVQFNIVTVPMVHAAGICEYTKLTPEEFGLLGSFLGVVQQRALVLNSELRAEDFEHNATPHCLFSRGREKEDVATIVERLFVCDSCYEFYRCLGLEQETEALKKVIEFVEYQRIDRSLHRRSRAKGTGERT
ncbi:MAG: hypothetical protein HYV27_06450 [Candidatus Hydrogenedentes bacterium]|nr:hypothetical protein [Candidatus Hydrogenedentota bacterium]